jgi:hypothetical protein
MKTTSTKIYKLRTGLLLLVLLMTITNCDDEIMVIHADQDLINQNSDHPGTEIHYITADDEPEIFAILDQQMVETSDKSYSAKTVSYKKTFIDLKKIMKVKNHEGIVNYGMNLIVEDGRPNEFFNVIINESSSGKKKDAYIVKYSMTEEDHAYFVANNSDFLHFKGKRRVMSLDDFYHDLEPIEKKSQGTAHECPTVDEIIDNTGGGQDGYWSNIGEDNSITLAGGYTPPPIGQGYNYYINGYDHMMGRHTSYTQLMYHYQSLRVAMQPVINYPRIKKIKDIPGTSPGCFASTLYFGAGSTSYAFTRMYSSGGTTIETDIVMEPNDDVAKAPINSKTAHEFPCPGEEGEIPVMVAIGLEKIGIIKNCITNLTITQEIALDNYMSNGIRFSIYSISDYLENNCTSASQEFATSAIDFLASNPGYNFIEILNNRTEFDDPDTGDVNNNPVGGEDTTSYNDFDPLQQSWPNVSPVIPIADFIGWNYNFPTVPRNCMDYAKVQIAKKGYQISNYFNSSGQTIQIYTAAGGVNFTELAKGLSYLKYALSNGIPVIVGVDAKSGSPNPNTDNTTDHFVVIVGMGSDSSGKYFRFYDNAFGSSIQGASSQNKLYYDSITGLISGTSVTNFGATNSPYVLTMIRKSK